MKISSKTQKFMGLAGVLAVSWFAQTLMVVVGALVSSSVIELGAELPLPTLYFISLNSPMVMAPVSILSGAALCYVCIKSPDETRAWKAMCAYLGFWLMAVALGIMAVTLPFIIFVPVLG